MRDGILCCQVILGSVPKTESFGVGETGFEGMLYCSPTTLENSENRCFAFYPKIALFYQFYMLFTVYKVQNMPIDSIEVVVFTPKLALRAPN